jgi:hypothetical protein
MDSFCELFQHFHYRRYAGCPRGKINILEGHSIGHSEQKSVMYIYPIPNGFRDRAISLYRRATRHVFTRVAKCIDVHGGIFKNVLYLVNCTNFVT